MSDPIKHECGVAMIRLLKPLAHYKEQYDSSLWAFHKLFLLMEKQAQPRTGWRWNRMCEAQCSSRFALHVSGTQHQKQSVGTSVPA